MGGWGLLSQMQVACACQVLLLSPRAPACPPPAGANSGWTEVISTNLEGSYNAAHACHPHMAAAGRGKVVFISSIAGTRSEWCLLGIRFERKRHAGGGMRCSQVLTIPLRSAAPAWRPAGAGTQVAYAASKGALLSLSRSLAAAWGKDNIKRTQG